MRQIKQLVLTLWAVKQDILSLGVWEFVGWLAYHFRNNPESNFFYYSAVIALAYLALFFLQRKEKAFFYVPFFRRTERREWLGSGTFEYVSTIDAFQITKSHNGVIYSKTLLWTNYRLNFDFRIENKSLGIIARAVNLSNYLMFQILENKIRIHIRINGMWYWPPEIEFNSSLHLRQWYRAEMECHAKRVVIKISDHTQEVFSTVWDIPEGTAPCEVFNEGESVGIVNFPIELDYGAVGFRNHGEELALIRDLFIQKTH